jgi:hypothetical protein
VISLIRPGPALPAFFLFRENFVQIATQVFPFFEIPNFVVRVVVLITIRGNHDASIAQPTDFAMPPKKQMPLPLSVERTVRRPFAVLAPILKIFEH